MTEAEFLPLFDRYRSMVYGLALSYTRSPQDAEDICQEVFLTLLEKPPAPGKERPWLAKVTVNRCRDLLASPWKKRREEDDTALERLSFQEPEEAGLFAALGELEPEYRALLHLRYYEGFSAAELGELSMDNGCAAVEFPDFTRGEWNIVKGYKHAYASPEDEAASMEKAKAFTAKLKEQGAKEWAEEGK